MQAKLLRVLESGEIQKLAHRGQLHSDFRLIAATNKDLKESVERGSFREDLYHRLNILELTIPPLRDRVGDIPLLARHFIELHAGAKRGREIQISNELYRAFGLYPWHGNIRELKNQVERTMLISGKDFLTAQDFIDCAAMGMASPGNDATPSVSNGTLEEMERARIESALRRHERNVSKAAAELGLTRQSLYRKMEKFGLR